MKVLHLANYYTTSKVYKNLVESFDQQSLFQTIYVAFADKRLDNINRPQLKTAGSSIIYRPILNLYSKINYFHKVRQITKDVEQIIPLKDINVIHAHTLFSDGGVALKLKKKYNIPYIVGVRSTDVNFFFKKLFYIRKTGIEVLKEAEQIIVISPALGVQLVNSYIPEALKEEISSKIRCIPNGITSYWHKNTPADKTIVPEKFNLLYAGTFFKRKNVPLFIKAAASLAEKIPLRLTIVGDGGTGVKEAWEAIEKYKKVLDITAPGKINDPDQLLQYFRQADIFVMPSRGETFGLVYIEALSQGLPIVYVNNTGVGGLFEEGLVGYGMSDITEEEIMQAIEKVVNNYAALARNTVPQSRPFNWEKIARDYIELYASKASYKK